jgi:hypothetical protein
MQFNQRLLARLGITKRQPTTLTLKKLDPSAPLMVVPGDVIVVRTGFKLTRDGERSLRKTFKRVFPAAKIMVLDRDVDFDVYGAV